MTIAENWGDGIYLGSASSDGSYGGCSNVLIQNCTVKNNRRNNIAIVDADKITIDKCKISGASGASPACGILIEPNTNNGNVPSKSVCKNIQIKNTTIKAKKKHQKNGQYFAFNILNPYYQTNNKVVAKNVTLSNCKITGDVGNYSGKKVVKKCTIKNHYRF